MGITIGSIASLVAPASPEDFCGTLYDRFTADDTLQSIAVVDGRRPVGLVRRMDLMLKLADKFGRPLFERRPVRFVMDESPMVIEAGMSLDEINARLVRDGASLTQGFIVTQGGLYHGIGTAQTVLQANMQRAEERMRQLERAHLAAESANRAKTQFLANMSHELRTPLNSIIGFSDLIIESSDRGKPLDAMTDYVGDIRIAGRHLLNVINSILDMSKIEAGAFELREDHEDPAELAYQAVRMMDGTSRRAEVKIEIEAPDHCEDLWADLQVARQVLINLLSNAVKFSPAGATVHLILSEHADGCFSFEVRDHGSGISPADLERVLKPFEQVDGAIARRHEGTGLGLPLVQAFMEAHGGTLALESEIGVGTRAIVTFPADRYHPRTKLFNAI
ncbi:sensor histidine kinase [Gimibacter soli]|uniref:histidine kinase n=1 Tax=Gimibacter soli TaxID=3024400 RepID=A0AAE9XR10_9PROT|nr:ATP-binding protein [Gimibacter soli]WCL55718.1 ATP-binding protein [Gimibacter soli]